MYTVIPTEQFEKDVKFYVKKKGFMHIGADIKAVTDELEKGNLTDIVLFIMQFAMMKKCICLPFITKRMITESRQIRKSLN